MLVLATMKKDIHPKFYPEAKVICACGASFTVGSTKEKLEIEICSNCHPFFSGNEKVIDSAGRVEKFKNRREKSSAIPKKAPKKVRAEKEEKVEESEAANVA